jgi:hypothetical protein
LSYDHIKVDHERFNVTTHTTCKHASIVQSKESLKFACVVQLTALKRQIRLQLSWILVLTTQRERLMQCSDVAMNAERLIDALVYCYMGLFTDLSRSQPYISNCWTFLLVFNQTSIFQLSFLFPSS